MNRYNKYFMNKIRDARPIVPLSYLVSVAQNKSDSMYRDDMDDYSTRHPDYYQVMIKFPKLPVLVDVLPTPLDVGSARGLAVATLGLCCDTVGFCDYYASHDDDSPISADWKIGDIIN